MEKHPIPALFLALLATLLEFAPAQESKLPPRPKDLDAALRTKAIATPPAEGRPLEIVDRKTDDPIADAAVFVIDAAALDALQKPLRELQQVLAEEQPGFEQTTYHRLLAHWYGIRYQTGADGTCTVAPFARSLVVAEAGDRFAVQTFRKWPEQPPTIPLVALEYYEVRVVDSNGKPAAEVPIGFGMVLGADLDPFFFAHHEGRTDSAGRLRVPRDRLRGQDALFVQALVVAPKPIRAKFERAADGKQTAIPTLQLPPCGMVRVLLYDENERPVERIQAADLQEATAGNENNFNVQKARPSQFHRGSALFRWVPLDQKIRAVVAVEGIDGTLTHEQDGPTHAGELVVCGVRMAGANPILRLRALDANGAPMANRILGLARTTSNSFDGDEITTDAEGRLQRTIDPEWLAAADPGQLLLVARGKGTQVTLYRGAFTVALADLKPGITDLGEVRFAEEPIVVGGVVVDADGKPLAGAMVLATMSHQNETTSSSMSSSGHALFFHHRVSTDAQGRFAIRELNPKELPMHLELADPNWVLAEAVDATPGETNLTLRAVRPGTAALTLAEPKFAADLRFYLRTDGDNPQRHSGEQSADGAVWKGLVPGRYCLAVQTSDQAVDVLSDLDIPTGDACSDPRLQHLDLTDLVRVIDVTVRDPAQVPIEGFLVRYMHLRGGGQGGNVGGRPTGRNGKVRLVLPAKGNRLLFHHADFRSLTIEEPQGDCTVDLVARANIRLRLADGVTLPDGIGLLVEPKEPIWWADELAHWQGTWNGKVAPVLRPDRDGELKITLRDRDGNPLWKGVITVPAGDTGEVTLPLDAETAADVGKMFGESGK